MWRSSSWYKTTGKKRGGFTLVESAVSLAANSLVLLLICGLLQAASSQERQLQLEKNAEWHLFLNQMEEDMKDKRLIYCREKELRFRKAGDGSTISYVVKNAEVVRLVYQKGHVPLLTGLRDIQYTQVSGGIQITVKFPDGQEMQGYVPVEQEEGSP